MPGEAIGKLTVSDIRKSVVENPAVVTIGTSIKDALIELVGDHRTRHIYITDKNGKMIDSVRVNNVIENLFPYETLWQSSSEYADLGIFSKKNLEDIINRNFVYVRDSTKVSDMISIMLREKINELPVLDLEMRIIGEVNILEVIIAYLKDDGNKLLTNN